MSIQNGVNDRIYFFSGFSESEFLYGKQSKHTLFFFTTLCATIDFT